MNKKRERKRAQKFIRETLPKFSERYDADPDFRAYVNTLPARFGTSEEDYAKARDFHVNFWTTLKGEDWVNDAKTLTGHKEDNK